MGKGYAEHHHSKKRGIDALLWLGCVELSFAQEPHQPKRSGN